MDLERAVRPKEAPKKKLSRNFEWKGEKETNAQRSARLTLDWDRRRRGETQEQTADIMKERLERESKRMEEVNRLNEEHRREEKERAERKLRKMEARERGEPVSEEEEFEFGTATNDVLVLHPQPHEFFDGFGGPAAVDVRVIDAQKDFQKSDEKKRVILAGPLGERGSWEQSPLPQREGKNKGRGKGRKEQEEERKEEEEDVSDKATSYEESESESREAEGRDEEREGSLAGEEKSEEWEIVEKYARETGMDVDSRANLIVMASQLILNNSGSREEEGREEGEEGRESEERTTRRKKDRARDSSSKARSRRDPSVEKRSKSRSSARQVKKKSAEREEEEEDKMEH